MAEATKGHSRVLHNRRWDSYESLKQYYKGTQIDEVIISGWGTTANAEFQFASETLDYIGAEGQVYVRCEADDANQHSKYVYLEYQDDTGQVMPILTDDLDATDSRTEQAIAGATDFYRVRQLISEVESATGGGKMITLTDADMGGGDNYAYIEDGNSQFILQRFFIQPNATAHSYLGRIEVRFPHMTAAATAIDAVLLTVTYTPKVLGVNDGFAESQVATNITLDLRMNHNTVFEPLIELQQATEVTFSWNHTTTAQIIWFEATLLEAYI